LFGSFNSNHRHGYLPKSALSHFDGSGRAQGNTTCTQQHMIPLRRLSEQHELPELPPGVDLPLRSLEELGTFEEKATEHSVMLWLVFMGFFKTGHQFHLFTSTIDHMLG